MKIKKIFIPIIALGSTLASCNSGYSHINRASLNNINYENATKIFESMKSEQEKTFLDKATLNFRYSLSMKGKCRYDDMSFHNFDGIASAGIDLSWSVEDSYMKFDGENETIYVAKDSTNNWWKYKTYKSEGKTKKLKQSLKDVITDKDSFREFINTTVDNYTCIGIPTFFSFGGGITGYNSYVSYLTHFSFQPDDFFSQETKEYFEKLGDEYKKENKGYSSSISYGSNDNKSLSANIKGKIKSKDLENDKKLLGYSNIDLFACYKDNFVSQMEFIIDGVSEKEPITENNFNCTYKIYISQETEYNKCTIDKFNPDEYNK